MKEITIDEMIEYIKSLINDFKKISKIKPTKLEAILASLKELKYIKQRIVSIQTICEGVNERLEQKQGKCRWTEDRYDNQIHHCSCSEDLLAKIYCPYCGKEIEWEVGECARRLRKCTKSGVVRIDM